MTDKNTDNSLEQFFQDKAKEYDITYREEDWLKLEKQLSLRDAKWAYKRKVRLIVAAALLLISLLGYFTFDNYNRLNLITQQLEQESALPAELPPPISPFPVIADGQAETEGELSDGHATAYADEQQGADEAAVSPQSAIAGDSAGELAKDDHAFDNRILAGDEPGPGRYGTDYLFGEITFSHINPVNLTTFSPAFTASRTLTVTAKPAEKQAFFPELDFTEPGRDLANRFTVGLVAGPDLSSIEAFSSFKEPGYKLGLMMEYNITSNLSVAAGAVQSLVRYTSYGQNYNPPIYWQGGITPDQIAGECLLIDIPINLRYNFLNLGNSRIFASVGFSSYIMLTEEYNFMFEGESYGQDNSWSGSTGTRHWFSNASFSIGYELDLNPAWSLRAEPYLKTPMREVGWGNVKLFSAGTLVSLNYRL